VNVIGVFQTEQAGATAMWYGRQGPPAGNIGAVTVVKEPRLDLTNAGFGHQVAFPLREPSLAPTARSRRLGPATGPGAMRPSASHDSLHSTHAALSRPQLPHGARAREGASALSARTLF